MRDIDKTRELINEVDSELAKLYEKRMELTRDVAEYKKLNNKPVYDPDREAEVISKNLKFLTNKNLEKYYVEFVQLLMDQSKEIQEQLIKEP